MQTYLENGQIKVKDAKTLFKFRTRMMKWWDNFNGGAFKTELQKVYFRPVSGFLTEKCPNHVIGEFCRNMWHKSKHRHVLFSSIVICSLNV